MRDDSADRESFESLLRGVAAAPEVDHARWAAGRLAPGMVLDGKLRIIRRLGHGGMGVVWLAHHDQLDRDLAVKLHLAHEHAASDLLLREARALAALADPHVLVVHDIGRVDSDVVYIAMEYVEGGTIRQWCRARVPTWPEIVDLFVQAAWGLAAAHGIGLVHGDVKPDNLLVGRDGRLRVADFGLARGPAEITVSVGHSSGTDRSRGLGTPAYMAPEQRGGQAPTAASDQFALCVSLWELLAGQRPLSVDGRLDELARDERLRNLGMMPRQLHQVIVRGLASDPSARYVDISALGHELRRCLPRGRRSLGTALGIAVALPVLVALAPSLTPAGAECADPQTRTDQLLPAARRDALAKRLATHDDASGGLFDVDDYARRWGEQAANACREHDAGRLGDDAFDRRNRCLDRRADELRALLEVLEQPTELELARVSTTLAQTTAPETCADDDMILRVPLYAEDPAVAAAMRRATIRMQLADHDGAEAELAPFHADRDLDSRSRGALLILTATLATRRGEYDDAEADLVEAFERFHVLGDDPRVVDAGAQLVALHAGALERIDVARSWWRRLEAEASRFELDAARQADLAWVHATWLVHAHRPAEAIGEYAHVVALLEEHPGVEVQWGVGAALNGWGRALEQLGRSSEALRMYERTLEHVLAAEPGPDSMFVAATLNNLGACAYDLDRYVESETYYRRAIETLLAVRGPTHPDAATYLSNLSNTLIELDRLPDALASLQQAHTILRASLGDHVAVAFVEHNLARVLRRMGRLDEARTHAHEAVDLERRLLGDGPELAGALDGLARVEQARGDDVAAAHALDEAIAIWHAVAAADPEATLPAAELDELAPLVAQLAHVARTTTVVR